MISGRTDSRWCQIGEACPSGPLTTPCRLGWLAANMYLLNKNTMAKSTTRKAPRSAKRPADAKLQRWIDLVAALLTHHYGATFDQLECEVPAYGTAARKGPRASIMRTFERDKDE